MSVKRILIVDDCSELRALLQAQFEAIGIRSVLADSRSSAFKIFSEDKMSVAGILSDTDMPGKGEGIQFLSEVREIDNEIPFFLMSGRLLDDIEVAKAKKLGLRECIFKPNIRPRFLERLFLPICSV